MPESQEGERLNAPWSEPHIVRRHGSIVILLASLRVSPSSKGDKHGAVATCSLARGQASKRERSVPEPHDHDRQQTIGPKK